MFLFLSVLLSGYFGPHGVEEFFWHVLEQSEEQRSSSSLWLKNNSFVIDLVSLKSHTVLWVQKQTKKLNFAFLCANESEYHCFETKKLFQKKLTDEEKMSSTFACIISWKIKILQSFSLLQNSVLNIPSGPKNMRFDKDLLVWNFADM